MSTYELQIIQNNTDKKNSLLDNAIAGTIMISKDRIYHKISDKEIKLYHNINDSILEIDNNNIPYYIVKNIEGEKTNNEYGILLPNIFSNKIVYEYHKLGGLFNKLELYNEDNNIIYSGDYNNIPKVSSKYKLLRTIEKIVANHNKIYFFISEAGYSIDKGVEKEIDYKFKLIIYDLKYDFKNGDKKGEIQYEIKDTKYDLTKEYNLKNMYDRIITLEEGIIFCYEKDLDIDNGDNDLFIYEVSVFNKCYYINKKNNIIRIDNLFLHEYHNECLYTISIDDDKYILKRNGEVLLVFKTLSGFGKKDDEIIISIIDGKYIKLYTVNDKGKIIFKGEIEKKFNIGDMIKKI